MTFRVRQIKWEHGRVQSDALLSLKFVSRVAATDHIKLLQAPYDAKGFDRTQDKWWARHSEKTVIHRWTIKEDDKA